MRSILFVCTHNACRSQIAEAICKKVATHSWIIESAGFNPSRQVDPKAVEILRKHQLSMNYSKPKGFSALPRLEWDFVVNMDFGGMKPEVSAIQLIRWNIPDPMDGPISAYQALYKDLTHHIRILIQNIERLSL
ncbi:MAG: low molecular weight phosphatase family protein [Nitrospirae bacterium]|nr:low molecular weight phosphatase family protein [Nitrospirota bacterium]MBI3593731.1 low molecular weight phosphatase family protein [Nitrospirota bacterium]